MNKLFLLLPFVALCGCQLFGSNPAPPSKFEQNLFTVQTNYVTNTILATNVSFKLVEVPVRTTNSLEQIVWTTNTANERITNYSFVTVTNEQYTWEPNEKAKLGASVVGSVANLAAPGSGGWVAALLSLGLGSWAQWRSTKRQKTSVTLAQQIETLREFIKTLPQGASYDTKITEWLSEHQVEAGVAKQVLAILEKETDNDAAKGAALKLVA